MVPTSRRLRIGTTEIRCLYHVGQRTTPLDRLAKNSWWHDNFVRPLFMLVVAKKGDHHALTRCACSIFRRSKPWQRISVHDDIQVPVLDMVTDLKNVLQRAPDYLKNVVYCGEDRRAVRCDRIAEQARQNDDQNHNQRDC